MKTTALAAAFLVLGAGMPAFAEDTQPATEAQAAKFTVETPIEALMADAQAAAVLQKHLPGIDQHPMYGEFKMLSLKAVAPFSQGLITEGTLTRIEADLAKLA
jgi:hypothetical protein